MPNEPPSPTSKVPSQASPVKSQGSLASPSKRGSNATKIAKLIEEGRPARSPSKPSKGGVAARKVALVDQISALAVTHDNYVRHAEKARDTILFLAYAPLPDLIKYGLKLQPMISDRNGTVHVELLTEPPAEDPKDMIVRVNTILPSTISLDLLQDVLETDNKKFMYNMANLRGEETTVKFDKNVCIKRLEFDCGLTKPRDISLLVGFSTQIVPDTNRERRIYSFQSIAHHSTPPRGATHVRCEIMPSGHIMERNQNGTISYSMVFSMSPEGLIVFASGLFQQFYDTAFYLRNQCLRIIDEELLISSNLLVGAPKKHHAPSSRKSSYNGKAPSSRQSFSVERGENENENLPSGNSAPLDVTANTIQAGVMTVQPMSTEVSVDVTLSQTPRKKKEADESIQRKPRLLDSNGVPIERRNFFVDFRKLSGVKGHDDVINASKLFDFISGNRITLQKKYENIVHFPKWMQEFEQKNILSELLSKYQESIVSFKQAPGFESLVATRTDMIKLAMFFQIQEDIMFPFTSPKWHFFTHEYIRLAPGTTDGQGTRSILAVVPTKRPSISWYYRHPPLVLSPDSWKRFDEFKHRFSDILKTIHSDTLMPVGEVVRIHSCEITEGCEGLVKIVKTEQEEELEEEEEVKQVLSDVREVHEEDVVEIEKFIDSSGLHIETVCNVSVKIDKLLGAPKWVVNYPGCSTEEKRRIAEHLDNDTLGVPVFNRTQVEVWAARNGYVNGYDKCLWAVRKALLVLFSGYMYGTWALDDDGIYVSFVNMKDPPPLLPEFYQLLETIREMIFAFYDVDTVPKQYFLDMHIESTTVALFKKITKKNPNAFMPGGAALPTWRFFAALGVDHINMIHLNSQTTYNSMLPPRRNPAEKESMFGESEPVESFTPHKIIKELPGMEWMVNFR